MHETGASIVTAFKSFTKRPFKIEEISSICLFFKIRNAPLFRSDNVLQLQTIDWRQNITEWQKTVQPVAAGYTTDTAELYIKSTVDSYTAVYRWQHSECDKVNYNSARFSRAQLTIKRRIVWFREMTWWLANSKLI